MLGWLVRNPDPRGATAVDAVVAFLRVAIGYSAALNGLGKLGRIDEIAAWFGNDLGIPFPLQNAYAASLTELIGGTLVLVGLGSRIAAVPLVFTMCVAYATSDRESLASLDLFAEAAPFPYLATWLLVLAHGPGAFSLDGLIVRLAGQRAPAVAASTGS